MRLVGSLLLRRAIAKESSALMQFIYMRNLLPKSPEGRGGGRREMGGVEEVERHTLDIPPGVHPDPSLGQVSYLRHPHVKRG